MIIIIVAVKGIATMRGKSSNHKINHDGAMVLGVEENWKISIHLLKSCVKTSI